VKGSSDFEQSYISGFPESTQFSSAVKGAPFGAKSEPRLGSKKGGASGPGKKEEGLRTDCTQSELVFVIEVHFVFLSHPIQSAIGALGSE
jgi:hypothetical protein